jgi:hypothetical protein
MPAQLVLGATSVQAFVKELRDLDKELYKQLRREIKGELTPVSKAIQAKIPSKAPLSGFAARNARGPMGDVYTWRKPTAGINTDMGTPAKAASGLVPLVSLFYRDQKGTAGFTILELAGSRNVGRFKKGLAPQGRAMIESLNKVYPQRSTSGRFALPYARPQVPKMRSAVEKVLVSFAKKINRRLK